MNKPVLTFQDVTFSYDQKGAILNGLNVQVFDREFISIVGASGSGKSTLFRLITGLEQPDKGKIFINEKEHASRLGQVGYMPQQDLLMPWRTILENAALPLEVKGMGKGESRDRVLPMLEEFGLKGVESRYPGELSGGMRQRVSFLRAVLSGSNVLLLDEPFSALDAITRLSMQEWLLAQWEKRKTTVLFITHDVNEALFLSDRIFIFTETPVQQLKEVKVALPRPRSLRDLNDPMILEMKDQLIEQLRKKVTT
ncbi:ABC transporter ATP-binding protein [Bacillus sp. REN10]|uniref:ABC transporter ATP-binding protein n=1 Tax=Bacillus sp. REN10 TaxID=2782541 RepID=UPI00193C4042|nr:ABC transporter ATP-binding protein [Bacillus sp. REN10]